MEWDRLTLKALIGVAAVVISGVLLLAGIGPSPQHCRYAPSWPKSKAPKNRSHCTLLSTMTWTLISPCRQH
jgi:hypothetical protein